MARRKSKRKKLTPNQQAYKKELNRIKSFMRRVSKRGYTLASGRTVPLEMPKRVTAKALRDIQRLTAEVLYYRLEKLDTSTGELVTGTAARKAERKKAARKARDNRIIRDFDAREGVRIRVGGQTESVADEQVIEVYKAELADLHPKGQYVLLKWLNQTLARDGLHITAEVIRKGKREGIIVEPGNSYKSEVLGRYIAEMKKLLQESRAARELVEQFEDVMDAEEDYEDF